MVRILLLSCGTNACYHIAKILKQKFSDFFFIVGCDINKKWLIPTCDYLDNFYQSPLSSENNYYSFVLDVCKKESIDYLIPSIDSDQFLFSCDNPELIEIGVNSLAISSTLDFYRSKFKTNDFLESIGIPVPKRFSKETVENNEDYFVKCVYGYGSIGIRKEKGSEIKNFTEIDTKNYIIQELCFEPEYTLECFLYNGKIYSVVRERIASKSGVCTKTRIFQDKQLELYAYKLAEKAKLPYIFNMQFMKNHKGEYVCTDLNLRTAGGMSMSYTAGWDEVSALACVMLGRKEQEIISTVDLDIKEQYVVRHYEDSVTKIVNRRIAFDLDGTLLDSAKRHEIVMADVLKNYMIDLDTTTLVSFKSEGKNNIDWLLDKGIDKVLANRINNDWILKIEDMEYLNSDVLYQNIFDILDQLSKSNELFLVTARNNKENAYMQINKLGISKFFIDISIVESCKDTALLKSDELKKYRIDWFVGDTESDYKASVIAGCNFKAVVYGFRSESFLKNHGIPLVSSISFLENSKFNAI